MLCHAIRLITLFRMKDNVEGQSFYQKIGAEKRDFIDVYSIPVTKLLRDSGLVDRNQDHLMD